VYNDDGGIPMRRWLIIACCLLLLTGCITPDPIKRISREQGQLLAEFQNTVAVLRSKLLEYYDARIDELRQDLVDAKLRSESLRMTAALQKPLQEIEPNVPPEEREALIRKSLNEASNYLVQLPKIYFDEEYCELAKRLRPDFLKSEAEACDDQHLIVFRRLRDARNRVAERFDQLAETVDEMEEAHQLIDSFLQIEFKLTEERMDAAKELIREAQETIEDAKEALAKVGRPGA
jgi:hypothetical protein